MKNWDEVYSLPLRRDKGTGWVHDHDGNFVFQFEHGAEMLEIFLLDIINGKPGPKLTSKFILDGILISTESGKEIILIRGWGNLTSKGGKNLSMEEAKNIQDTFAEFILSKLNENA